MTSSVTLSLMAGTAAVAWTARHGVSFQDQMRWGGAAMAIVFLSIADFNSSSPWARGSTLVVDLMVVALLCRQYMRFRSKTHAQRLALDAAS